MDRLLPDTDFWRNRRVFLTGHTGFKGGWMALWLRSLGARVCGYALAPDTTPSLYHTVNIADSCEESHFGDIRDRDAMAACVNQFAPELVIHMAAQPLVRRSYRAPLDTLATNIMGTAHLLEACRTVESLRGIVVITTDKCYHNKETLHPYREDDALGGHDIYSASKACAEIVTHAYRQSFFAPLGHVRIATARAGNVIGGGDWSEDRLLPDAVRAFSQGQALTIRSPDAVRPWQHVAEPLLGYLMLSRALLTGHAVSPAYNFGPDHRSTAPVREVITQFAAQWQPAGKWHVDHQGQQVHEAKLLTLDSTLAQRELGWTPRFDLAEAITHTASWYRDFYNGHSAGQLRQSMLDVCGLLSTKPL